MPASKLQSSHTITYLLYHGTSSSVLCQIIVLSLIIRHSVTPSLKVLTAFVLQTRGV